MSKWDETETTPDLSRTMFRTMNRFVRPLVKAGLGTPLPVGLSTVVLEANDEASVWFCGRRHSATATIQRGPLNVVTLDSTT